MTTAEESEPTEDQLAIRSYFESDRFHAGRVIQHAKLPRRPMDSLPVFAASGIPSLVMGIFGLAALTCVFGAALPMVMHFIEESNIGRPSYLWMMVLVQSVLYPPLLAFAFSITAPMFHHIALSARCLLSALATLPGCFCFLISIEFFEGHRNSIWYDFFIVMSACFVAVASVAVIIQLFTPWTATHLLRRGQSLPQTGLRSLIELTAIAAAACAVIMANNFMEYWEGVLLFAGVGLILSFTIISVMMAFLRPRGINPWAIVIGMCFTFAAAFFVSGFFAALEFGWDAIGQDALYVGVAAFYGSIVITLVMAMCIVWLRSCGWSCIHRREYQKAIESELGDEDFQ